MKTKNVTRLEIISKERGREYVTYTPNKQELLAAEVMIENEFEHSFQDDGKTLKIFVR